MSMFGAGRQSGVPPAQGSRMRRPNLRPASPGPSSSVPGGGLFASTSVAAGKAPAGGYSQQPPHRERHQSQALTQDQKEEIFDAFNLFDLNQDHKIDYHELKVAMKALGFDVPKPELLELLNRHGVLISGQPPATGASATNLYITYEAFVDIMTQKIAERDPLEEIGRAFELFAGVSGGARPDGREAKIRIEDLRRVAKELGESLEEEELQAMIEEFDVDNDGMISREEFISICRSD